MAIRAARLFDRKSETLHSPGLAGDEALAETNTSIPADVVAHLPKLLWLYQMGLILFWIYDRSEGQARTMRLLELVEILES